MPRRIVTKETRVAQIAQGLRAADIDSSLQVAIQGLQAQVNAIHAALTEIEKNRNTSLDETGSAIATESSPCLVDLENLSGSDRSIGDVVVFDPSAPSAFNVTDVTGDIRVAGVVYRDTPDGVTAPVPEGAVGEICIGGEARVRVDASAGAVFPGDYLVSHSVPGFAAKAASRDSQGVFAVALGSITDGTGVVDAIVVVDNLALAETVRSLRDFDVSLFRRDGYYRPDYDDDGTATGFSGVVAGAGLWDSPVMSTLVGRWNYFFSTGAQVTGCVHSVYGADGDPVATVTRAVAYQQNRIAGIISEIS